MTEKNKISKKLRCELWDLHFENNKNKNKCKCCNNYIEKEHFVVGHIYPEVCGGKLDIYNLLPICNSCNKKMGGPPVRNNIRGGSQIFLRGGHCHKAFLLGRIFFP